MDPTLADVVQEAAKEARRRATAYRDIGPVGRDALPWAVIKAYDDNVRRHVARDRRLEDERDRVLIAAVKLAETPPTDEGEVADAREHLIDAIDYLEQAVLRFGIRNSQSRTLGRGTAG